jgi:rhamnosyltransferase
MNSTKLDVSERVNFPTRVGIAIPTLNAGDQWRACLDAIASQSLKPWNVLVIDSSSTDSTPEVARSAGFEVLRIERSQFNHGATRQQAVEHLNECEIVIFLTQDAVPASRDSFAEIVRCFDDPAVAVAYGRQLPHSGATAIEAHARIFNYGELTVKKDAEAIERMGTKVFFCSNSFAAYRRSTVLSLGGFNGNLILGEDMEFAARAVRAGYANMYCAKAQVYHSHDYSVGQTVRRYFDLGAFDALNPWMREQFGSHSGEGLRYIASELRYLAEKEPWQIPRAMLQTAAKLLGYRLGRAERLLSVDFKRRISMLPSHWR